jgi:hypothetical protein
VPRALVVTRNPVAGIAALLGALATYVAIVADLALVIAAVPMLTLVAAAAWAGWYRPRKRPAELAITPEGVKADGRTLATRRSLRAGDAAEQADGRWQVDLHRWFGQRVRLVVGTAKEAREALAALGFDRRVGTTTFRVRRSTFLSLDVAVFGALTSLVIAFVLAGLSNTWWPLLLPLVVMAVAGVVRRMQTLTVGADGVTIGQRFIPFSQIRGVGPGRDPRVLELDVEPDEHVRLDTTPERLRAGSSRDHVRAIVAEAWLRAKRRPATNAASLLRGDRDVKDWVASLRTNQGGYRIAAMDDDELFAIVTDPRAAQEARVGAAIALAAKSDHAPRLRVAADDIADPVVRRVALAALDDDAELEAELDAALRSK